MREPTEQEMNEKRVVLGDALDDPGFEVSTLVGYMVGYGIPVNARIVYAGCGSHALALDWNEVKA